MASASKTPNLNLPQWVGTEKPERTDFNAAFDAIDTNLNLVEVELMPIRGTSGNIHYTKFPDGTMIVRGMATITNFSASFVDVGLPASFTNTSFSADATVIGLASGSTNAYYVTENSILSASSIRIKALIASGAGINPVTASTNVSFICVGFWK